MTVLVVALAFFATLPALGQDELTLRVNDAQASPGGLVAITVRTYASRPVSQGQLTIRPRRARAAARAVEDVSGLVNQAAEQNTRGDDDIFDSIHSWVVFSSNGDATGNAGFVGSTSDLDIDFASITASINDADGPMLVIYAWLKSSVALGEYDLDIDLGALPLEDENGQLIPADPRSGTLDVVAPSAPLEIGVEGEDSEPGTVARLAIVTEQVRVWSSGFFEVTYPTSIAADLPTVEVDPRYGSATLGVTHPEPGRVTIAFQTEEDLNFLPGEVIQILLPLDASAPEGFYPLSIDPASAHVWERDTVGDPVLVPLALEPGGGFQVAIVPIFTDGFEDGTTSAWQ